ncbi:MAG: inorganic pyrophosphatase, partial [Candidatus Binatia bacterium]
MDTDYLKWRPHPWHGLDTGPEPPSVVNVFVEITPFDHIKYEVDKHSGYLQIDRPQYSSSRPPTVYGFIPRTLAGPKVGSLMEGASSGDDDPLDICVVSTHAITQSQILLRARAVGGIPMLDAGTADDKIIAVLMGDAVWAEVTDVSQLPSSIIDQLVHYFSTYKRMRRPDHAVLLGGVYGREQAEIVISAAMADYA